MRGGAILVLALAILPGCAATGRHQNCQCRHESQAREARKVVQAAPIESDSVGNDSSSPPVSRFEIPAGRPLPDAELLVSEDQFPPPAPLPEEPEPMQLGLVEADPDGGSSAETSSELSAAALQVDVVSETSGWRPTRKLELR